MPDANGKPPTAANATVPAEGQELTPADHRHLLAELDTLLAQVAELMKRFESTGYHQLMRDDYLALHRMQARALQERLTHSNALGLPPANLATTTTHH